MKLLDINQLSELINIKKKTIYDWVHEEQIPYLKIGRLVRFEYDDILKWLELKKRRRKRYDIYNN